MYIYYNMYILYGQVAKEGAYTRDKTNCVETLARSVGRGLVCKGEGCACVCVHMCGGDCIVLLLLLAYACN